MADEDQEESEGLEEQLFAWEGWDQLDTMEFSFTDVTLKVPIGKFPKGTKFEWATFSVGSATLVLGNGEEGWEFDLTIAVEGGDGTRIDYSRKDDEGCHVEEAHQEAARAAEEAHVEEDGDARAVQGVGGSGPHQGLVPRAQEGEVGEEGAQPPARQRPVRQHRLQAVPSRDAGGDRAREEVEQRSCRGRCRSAHGMSAICPDCFLPQISPATGRPHICGKKMRVEFAHSVMSPMALAAAVEPEPEPMQTEDTKPNALATAAVPDTKTAEEQVDLLKQVAELVAEREYLLDRQKTLEAEVGVHKRKSADLELVITDMNKMLGAITNVVSRMQRLLAALQGKSEG